MRISDWSSDVCSSDLAADLPGNSGPGNKCFGVYPHIKDQPVLADGVVRYRGEAVLALVGTRHAIWSLSDADLPIEWQPEEAVTDFYGTARSEEHTSELQSLMRISYAVFCLKKKRT